MLLDHATLVLQDADAVAALVRYRKIPALGFSDCLVLELARKADLPLGTFDRELAKLEDVERL